MSAAGLRSRLAALNERLSILSYELISSAISWRETRHALRTSRECLRRYRELTAAPDEIPACDLYLRVVMAQSGASEDEAREVLNKAAQSFASWPRPRPLRLADVAHYLAVSGYLAGRSGYGTKVNMGLLVAGRIPSGL